MVPILLDLLSPVSDKFTVFLRQEESHEGPKGIQDIPDGEHQERRFEQVSGSAPTIVTKTPHMMTRVMRIARSRTAFQMITHTLRTEASSE